MALSAMQNIADRPYEYHVPTQEPLDPPYKLAVELKRKNLLLADTPDAAQ